MPRPTLTDDRRTVTLDLHGATVAEAVAMIRRVCSLAAKRGRSSVRVVHGSSTSDPAERNRTIRHALLDLLEGGELDEWVVQSLPGESTTLLGLAVSAASDPRPLRTSDLES